MLIILELINICTFSSDEKEYTCYGEDWAGYKFFKAIYDQIKKEWYIMQGESRMKQFPTHWEPIN